MVVFLLYKLVDSYLNCDYICTNSSLHRSFDHLLYKPYMLINEKGYHTGSVSKKVGKVDYS